MKTIIGVLLLTFLISSNSFAQPNEHQTFHTTSKTVIGYLQYLPSDYHSNSDKYPVVIFLHGIGERGTDSTDPAVLQTSIASVDNLGPPKHTRAGASFPFILISPQLKKIHGSWPTWYVMEVIDHIKTYLRIDERRIHISGLSLGGGGTWVMAQDYPKLFATVTPICGGINTPSKACNIAAENIPVWAFHGDKDTIVPLSKSVTMVDAVNACLPTPNPKAMLSIYPGVAHDAWERAYAPDHSWHNPNIYEWLMQYTNLTTAGNYIPVANAGSDRMVYIPSTTSVDLSSSATDKDGTIASYQWTKMSGPSAILSNEATGTLNVSSLVEGSYVFRLQVTDNSGNTDSDYITLKVEKTPNVPPVAEAGTDKLFSLPTNSISLTANATDTDGTVVSYSWAKVDGGNATLVDATSSTLTATDLVAGTYTFRVTAKDNDGGTASDDVIVKVNNPPSVSVGADIKLILPNNSVTIEGVVSDTDGTVVSYKWAMLTGTNAVLSGTTTSTLTATGLTEGSYVFRLVAKDDIGASKHDDVKIIVLANNTPVAKAGYDQVVSLPTNSVTLSGTGTDPDGTIVSYAWTQVSGSSTSISGQTTSTLMVSNMVAGTYTFRLTVTDNAGNKATDDVNVTVNNPPTVSVGADFSVTLPNNSLTVKGTASDSDGAIASYSWKMTTGTTATLSGTTTPTLSATGLIEGSYVFRLYVKDNHGATKFDDVKITVKSSTTSTSTTTASSTTTVNKAPVAYAGADKVLTLPTNSLTITGTATDSDGTITSWNWVKLTGGTATMSGTTTNTLSVTGMTGGSYVFRLTVKDNSGSAHYDDIKIVVNTAPVVSAGADATVTLPTNSVKLSGTATDADGTIVNYAWVKWSGPTATLSGNTTPTLTVTNLVEGVYVFRLSAKDNSGSSRYDEVTVTVKNATTTGASLSADVTILESNEEIQENTGLDLDKGDERFWMNKKVIIYDGNGKLLFNGKWSTSGYEDVIRNGLYIYNVVVDGKTVKQGKIFRM